MDSPDTDRRITELGDGIPGAADCDRGIGLAAMSRQRPHQALHRFDDAAVVFQACGMPADAAERDVGATGALAG